MTGADLHKLWVSLFYRVLEARVGGELLLADVVRLTVAMSYVRDRVLSYSSAGRARPYRASHAGDGTEHGASRRAALLSRILAAVPKIGDEVVANDVTPDGNASWQRQIALAVVNDDCRLEWIRGTGGRKSVIRRVR